MRQSNFSAGADQAEDALLDQVEQVEVLAHVAAGVRDDQPQVRVDQPLLCLQVAALDALGEVDLLLLGEQRIAAHLVEEELERVRGGLGEVAVAVAGRLGRLFAAVVLQREPGALDALLHQLRLFIREIHFLHQRIDLRQIDAVHRPARLDQGRDALLDPGVELNCGRVHFLSHGCPLYRVAKPGRRRSAETIQATLDTLPLRPVQGERGPKQEVVADMEVR